MESRRIYRWTAVTLAAGIAAGSMLRGSVTADMQTRGILHPIVHVVLFACLTGLLVKSTRSRWLRWLLCVAVVLLGFGTEWYEHLQDGFPVESADVLADSLGVGIVLLITAAADLLRWATRRTRPEAGL